MNINNLKTTNILLLALVIPLVFYVINILSSIFIPLVGAMFIALLFLPIIRWCDKKHIHKILSISFVVLIIIIGIKLVIELLTLTTLEIRATKDVFLDKLEVKLLELVKLGVQMFGIDSKVESHNLVQYLKAGGAFNNIGTILKSIGSSVSMFAMMMFYVILLLAGSLNFQQILNKIIFHQQTLSIRIFHRIEKDLITFIKVKFFISLLTGICVGLTCVAFDISFPLFWGIFTFVVNFVQMIGSVCDVILLGLFALVEIDSTGTWLFFVLTIIGIQILCGSVLEPIFMGKSFSINIITILVMLLFWGFIWGIPGMIMAIPITVFIKILLEQFPRTQVISELLSGPDLVKPINKIRHSNKSSNENKN